MKKIEVERELELAGRGLVFVAKGSMRDFKAGETVQYMNRPWLIRGVEGTQHGKTVGLLVSAKPKYHWRGPKADYIIIDEMKEYPPEFRQEYLCEPPPPKPAPHPFIPENSAPAVCRLCGLKRAEHPPDQ